MFEDNVVSICMRGRRVYRDRGIVPHGGGCWEGVKASSEGVGPRGAVLVVL